MSSMFLFVLVFSMFFINFALNKLQAAADETHLFRFSLSKIQISCRISMLFRVFKFFYS